MKKITFLFILFYLIHGYTYCQTPELVIDFKSPPSGIQMYKLNKVGQNLFVRYTLQYTDFLAKVNTEENSLDILKQIHANTISEAGGLGNKLLFTGWDNSQNSRELWASDGTSSNTQMVKDINPNTGNSDPNNYITKDNICYFSAQATSGRELWRTDGTEKGTFQVKDINIGSKSSSPFGFIEFQGYIYFFADNEVNGVELWKTDGSKEGTQMVKDIYVGKNSSRDISWSKERDVFTIVGGNLFFFAYTDQKGAELWKTDGTSNGTSLVKDIFEGSFSSLALSSEATQICFNNVLYFTASDGKHGMELWRSDGTEQGTFLVKDICPNLKDVDGSFPTFFTILQNKIYFIAYNPKSGREIWFSDGTSEGTQLLKDINPSTSNERIGGIPISSCQGLINHNDVLYFITEDGIHGRELWVSDGTREGTNILFDFNSGKDNGFNSIYNVGDLIFINDRMYFIANDGKIGNSIWRIKI